MYGKKLQSFAIIKLYAWFTITYYQNINFISLSTTLKLQPMKHGGKTV